MLIRDERADDVEAIAALTTRAFESAPHAGGNEAAILGALRRANVLAVSLAAEADGSIVGHVAFSPVRIGGQPAKWFGLGPVSVEPAWQRRRVGTALVEAGLAQLRKFGAQGCVVLGDPAYYRRFGFTSEHRLRYAGAPAAYFQSLKWSRADVAGEVTYDAAFDI